MDNISQYSVLCDLYTFHYSKAITTLQEYPMKPIRFRYSSVILHYMISV